MCNAELPFIQIKRIHIVYLFFHPRICVSQQPVSFRLVLRCSQVRDPPETAPAALTRVSLLNSYSLFLKRNGEGVCVFVVQHSLLQQNGPVQENRLKKKKKILACIPFSSLIKELLIRSVSYWRLMCVTDVTPQRRNIGWEQSLKLFIFNAVFKNIFLVPHHTSMGNFGNRANFRLPVFGGFIRFWVCRMQKTQNYHGVRGFVS